MCTIDTKDTYRVVSIHPDDWSHQGLHWDFAEGVNTYLKDNRLCMGLSSSPYVFSKISDFLYILLIGRELLG